MFRFQNNNLFHNSKTIHVIKHVNTGTVYGIRNCLSGVESSFIVCFENRKDAVHIMKSITTHEVIYNKKPLDDRLCVYNILELIANDKAVPFEYGLYTSELYLTDLLTDLSKRNMGVFLITDILNDKDKLLTVQHIQIYPSTPIDIDLNCLEDDFNL
jgi:hypothetical protein